MKPGIRVLVVLVNILYPFAIFAGLLWLDAPMKVFPAALAGILALNLLADFPALRRGDRKALGKILGLALAVTLVVVLMAVTENAGYAKLYPVFVNAFLLLTFAYTLIKPPTMIFRFARLQDKSLVDAPDRPHVEAYCRKVTIVWVAFFVLNMTMAFITATWGSDAFWSLYNGLISYILIGLLLGAEFLVRRRVRRG